MNLLRIKSFEKLSNEPLITRFLEINSSSEDNNDDSACGSLGEPTENLNSHPYCMYPYYPQTMEMASVVAYVETLNWQWHYDHALDSIYLMGQTQVRLYIFFWLSFAFYSESFL